MGGARDGDALGHIVCCVEESPGSRAALDLARRLRALAPGRLSILHVYEPALAVVDPGIGAVLADDRGEEEIRGWLSGLAEESPGAEAVLLSGAGRGAPAAVCRWAADAHADLIVAGALRGRVDRALRGDFTGYLVRHAPCSVLVVRPRG